ncbi:MAG TPA: serine/threonine-protein kinase [Gemmatimonadales bacterium]|nr:serine/threonine-protein kinase [Gemmatimonadales bacterium]
MADVLSGLASALAGRYSLERELGRGGMATVWLATDARHGRPVAVKVLSPDVAATLGTERFLREIRVIATLRHPHILPLLDSGEAAGRPFYVMPYVEGETLRERLRREKQLPLEDALQIARQVADALSYAHHHGVVHRDVKPENILLESGHAVVADFGIAKAVTAAADESLTATGLAVGTPAYMSPEQAAGSKNLDGRSDLYSLGCVLYELLAGQPPFTGPTVESVIHQHLTLEPRSVTSVRPAVPAFVGAALARALAKTPADRFTTIADFGAALRSPVSSRRPPRHPPRRWVALLASAVTVLALVAVAATWFFRTGRAGTLIGERELGRGDLVLLADFKNETSDSTLADAVREALRAALADLRVVRLLDPAAVRAGLARMGRPAATRLDEELARELAEREDATAFVTGEVTPLGNGYQFSVRVSDVAAGRLLLVERATARSEDDVIAAVDRLAGRLRRGIGESVRDAAARPALARVTTPSLPALRAYSAGYRLFSQGKQTDALPFLKEAVALDSGFASAYALIGVIQSNRALGESSEAFERAYLLRDRLPEPERLRTEGIWHTVKGDYDRAVVAFLRLAELDPAVAGLAAINISNARLNQHRWTEAESVALRAVAVEPRWVAVYNAMEAQLAQGRLAAAESLFRRVAAEPEMRSLRTSFATWLLFARRDWTGVRAYVRDSLPPGSSAGAVLAVLQGRLRGVEAAGVPVTGSPLSLRLPLIVLRYRGDSAAAVRMIAQWREQIGWDTLRPAARPYARLIPLLAEVGRAGEARGLLAEWKAVVPPTDPFLRSDHAAALGAIAFADGRFDTAAAHFLAWHAAPYAGGTHETNRGLVEAGMALDQAGRFDTALVLYRRAINEPALEGAAYDALWYPIVLRRVGELYETGGQRDSALAFYGQFVGLWRDADPELQRQVNEIRQRVSRLASERR